jgi:hypothetical protein
LVSELLRFRSFDEEVDLFRRLFASSSLSSANGFTKSSSIADKSPELKSDRARLCALDRPFLLLFAVFIRGGSAFIGRIGTITGADIDVSGGVSAVALKPMGSFGLPSSIRTFFIGLE